MAKHKTKTWKINRYHEVVASRDRYGTGDPKASVGLTTVTSPEGQFFLKCIERWALVAAEVDGEDTAGRQRLRRMTPSELIFHAHRCTELAFEQMDRCGWLCPMPDHETIQAAVEENESNS